MTDFRSYPLGGHPSPLDPRDVHASLAISPEAVKALPPKFIYDTPLPVLDQGQEGTCTANAFTTIMKYHLIKAGIDRTESRRDIYTQARILMPIEGQGAIPKSLLDAAKNSGVCREETWPYVAGKPGVCGPAASVERPLSKISGYAKVAVDVNTVKVALISGGSPLMMQIPVYGGFYSPDSTHTVHNIPVGEEHGFHEIVLLGYDDTRKAFLVQNSWGKNYGDNGHVWYPYNNPIAELWTLTPAVVNQAPKVKDFWQTLLPWIFH